MLNFASNNDLVTDQNNDFLLDNDYLSTDDNLTEASIFSEQPISFSSDEVLLNEDQLFDSELDFGSVDTEASTLQNFSTQQLLPDGDDLAFESSDVPSATSIETLVNLSAVAQEVGSLDVSYLQGTLEADLFIYTPGSGNETVVISGNGNLNYGEGYSDLLDFSAISVEEISDFSFAAIDGGGAIVETEGGDRVLDYITLNNGDRFFFEGIDRIEFSDYEIDLTVDPDDTYYGDQWNLHMMGVQNAWRFTTGSENVLVGVQDTGLGVDGSGYFHPDLGHTLYYSDNVADEFYREVPGDSGEKSSSHGTAVHGIIGAETDNGSGVAGINWDSSVFNIDVLDANAGDYSLTEATQSMIDYATSEGQRLVINMSLGGGSIDPAFEQLVADNQDDVLFVIASGNSGHLGEEGISSPAILAQDYDNVMAVGASWGAYDENGWATEPGTRIEYDYWGSQYGEGLTLMGPSEVLTTGAFPDYGFDYHSNFNGTSAATPNVAGVASLVWSANENLDATQIKEILSDTAYDLGEEGYDIYYGHGFVNADAAVRRAIALSYSDQSTENDANSVPEIDSLFNGDYTDQLATDSFLLEQQVFNDYYSESTADITYSLGASTTDEGMVTSPDYSLEGYDSALHHSWTEENIFYNQIEI